MKKILGSLGGELGGSNVTLKAAGRRLALMVILVTVLLALTAPTASAQIANARESGPGIVVDDVNGGCHVFADYSEYGDLITWIEFNAWLYSPSGQLLAAVELSGTNSVDDYVWANLAVTGTYVCTGELWLTDYFGNVWYGYYEGGFYFFVQILDLTVNTFIPENNEPASPWHTGEGDNRSFNRYGSSRTTEWISVRSPIAFDILDASETHDVGQTALYDINTSLDGWGLLTSEARDDWEWGGDKKLFWGSPDGDTLSCGATRESRVHMIVDCHGAESVWFLEALEIWPFSVGIGYDFIIHIWFYNESDVEFLVEGSHDGYPNYEIYVGGQRIYEWDHGANSQGLLSLGPPQEVGGWLNNGWVD